MRRAWDWVVRVVSFFCCGGICKQKLSVFVLFIWQGKIEPYRPGHPKAHLYLIIIQNLHRISGSHLQLQQFAIPFLDFGEVLFVFYLELVKVDGVQDFAHFFFLFELEVELVFRHF